MTRRILSVFFALCFALSVFIPSSLAADDFKQLTLDDAVKMALDRNRNLKIQDLQVDKAEEELSDMRSAIKHVPATGVYIPDVSNVWRGYLLTENNQRIAAKKLEALKQQLVVDVKAAYYDILRAEKKLITAEEALKIAKVQLQQARIKQEVGMSTNVEVQGIETNFQSANKDVVAAKNAMEDAKNKLAILIGMNGDFNYSLVDDAEYEPADFTSKDAVVAKALSQRWEIWAAERSAFVTDRAKDYADNYNVGKIEADIAGIEAGNTKDNMKKNVEYLYLLLKELDESYKTLEQTVKTSEEQKRVTELQYQVGLATELQKQQAEQKYNQALQQMRELIYTYDETKSQLQMLTGVDLVSAITADKENTK